MSGLMILYIMFCAGVITGANDEDKWGWKDYLILLLSPILIPFYIGYLIGEYIKNHKEENQ